jgi:glycosyltransferase involved in cell wall biosynthesis
VVSHPFNLGYGAALQTGYKYAVRAGYGTVVQMDADGQHDPADIPRLLAPVWGGEADLVIGSRFVQASDYDMGSVRSAARQFFTFLLVLLAGRALPIRRPACRPSRARSSASAAPTSIRPTSRTSTCSFSSTVKVSGSTRSR